MISLKPKKKREKMVPDYIIETCYCKICQKPIIKPAIQRHLNSRDHNYNLNQVELKQLRLEVNHHKMNESS